MYVIAKVSICQQNHPAPHVTAPLFPATPAPEQQCRITCRRAHLAPHCGPPRCLHRYAPGGCARGSSLCQKSHRVRQRDTPLFGNVDRTCRPYPRGRQRARPGRQEHMLAVFTCVVPAGTSSACASAARCTSGRESTCSGGSETRAPSLFRCSFSLGAVASENFFWLRCIKTDPFPASCRRACMVAGVIAGTALSSAAV